MEEEKANDQVSSLLMVNGLDYRMPPSLSVAVSRSHAVYVANQQSYIPGQTVNIVMSNGAQYVNFRESYLTFTVTMTGDDTVAANANTWSLGNQLVQESPAAYNPYKAENKLFVPGRNGALNLFNASRWIHSSGTLLDEMPQDMALWSYIRNRYTYTSDQMWSQGSLAEFGNVNSAQTVWHPLLNTPATDPTEEKYVIRLSDIADCFNQQQLCPSFICAGSRLELRLSDFSQAFTRIQTVNTTDADPVPGNVSYVMSNVSIVLQQIQLTDSIVRALSNISASSGLEYPFTSIATNTTINSSQRGSIQQSRALSRANAVIVVRRENSQMNGPRRYDLSSFCPSEKQITKYSCQLGGQTIPLSPVESPKEAYWQAQVTFGHAFDPTTCTPVTYLDFLGTPLPAAGALPPSGISDAIYALSLETSSNLNQSGSALSSQRVLVFDYVAELPANLDQAVYTMYVPHVRLCSSFLDSVIVRT
jgi:hypothetical protein